MREFMCQTFITVIDVFFSSIGLVLHSSKEKDVVFFINSTLSFMIKFKISPTIAAQKLKVARISNLDGRAKIWGAKNRWRGNKTGAKI